MGVWVVNIERSALMSLPRLDVTRPGRYRFRMRSDTVPFHWDDVIYVLGDDGGRCFRIYPDRPMGLHLDPIGSWGGPDAAIAYDTVTTRNPGLWDVVVVLEVHDAVFFQFNEVGVQVSVEFMGRSDVEMNMVSVAPLVEV